jgi:solute carrier family 25 protein 39/40
MADVKPASSFALTKVLDTDAMADQPNTGGYTAAASHTSWKTQAISASVAALISCCITQPLDVVKVRIQSQHYDAPSSSSSPAPPLSRSTVSSFPTTFARPGEIGVTTCCREVFFTSNTLTVPAYCNPGNQESCAIEVAKQRQFTGMFDAIFKIARYEGPLNLWKGLFPTM